MVESRFDKLGQGSIVREQGNHRVGSWPEWWTWELELTSHVEKRMEDRGFTEVELRDMLERATGYREDVLEGRWVIETRHRLGPWEVIVEPDSRERLLVIITSYETDR